MRRVAIVGVGAVLAVAMGWLGLWQMQVFEDQGTTSAEARAAQAPLELSTLVGDELHNAYGRQVIARGSYVPGLHARVTSSDNTTRLVSGFRLDDGRLLVVVRGLVGTDRFPDSPAGTVVQSGVLLPSEGARSEVRPGDDLGSVNLPQLVQTWPQPLVDGYVTLADRDAQSQGLQPAPAELPSGRGSARNIGYALQWWVFGAFALGAAIFIARGSKPQGGSGSGAAS